MNPTLVLLPLAIGLTWLLCVAARHWRDIPPEDRIAIAATELLGWPLVGLVYAYWDSLLMTAAAAAH